MKSEVKKPLAPRTSGLILGRQLLNLPLKEPAEPPLVPFLQLLLHPILSGHDPSAVPAPAFTFQFIVLVIRRRPVVGEFFSRRDISHGNENNLPLDCNVRVAGMVCINHGAVSLLLLHRRNEKLFRYLNIRRPEAPLECRPFLFGENVASLDRHNLSRSDRLFRKQTFAVDRAVPHFRLWRTIAQISHFIFSSGPIENRTRAWQYQCPSSAYRYTLRHSLNTHPRLG